MGHMKMTESDLYDAFFKSPYTYADVELLSWYWQTDIGETKQRIGRKVLWRNTKILDHMLYRARGEYNWIKRSPYTASDAQALADLWGLGSAEDAKVVGGHKIDGWLTLTEALVNAEPDVHFDTYVVRKGDTLSGIAQMLSTKDAPVTWQDLYEENRDQIEDPDLIYPGQVLRVWGRGSITLD